MTQLLREFNDQQALIADLTHAVGSLLTRAIERNGRASLAVSGGSTPKPLFDELSKLDLAWERVVISLVDERWVEPDANDSNERLVRTHLLQDRAAAATFIGMKNDAPTASLGEAQCERRLQQVPLPFDLVILGMGNDGHTASLFPGAGQLAQATDLDLEKICMAVRPPAASHERMTLTLPAILTSRMIFLHITGPRKKEILRTAMEKGSPERMPIRFVLTQQQVPLTIYWAP